jgi:UDP-3-O-[3-hydroxymyristoyl] glucosamine N-acyltransferase
MKLSNPIKVNDLAKEYNLKYAGNGELDITGINEIHKVESGDLAYVDHPKYYKSTLNSAASVIIINKEVEVPEGKAILISENPFAIYNELVEKYMIHFEKPPQNQPYYVSPDAEIGEGTIIYPGAYIANNVKIGKNCIIHPNVVIYNGCILGDNVIIKANSVIGGDAFYYTNYKKWHSCGRVILHDNVNIGSCTTIDKGVSGDTIVGKDTKIDNEVHLAHGVVVGERCLMAAEVGVAGKTIIGDDVILLGQAGVVKDVKIGDGAVVLSKSLITKDVPGGINYFGLPAQDTRVAYKELASLRRLPNWQKRIEDAMKELEKKLDL